MLTVEEEEEEEKGGGFCMGTQGGSQASPGSEIKVCVCVSLSRILC